MNCSPCLVGLALAVTPVPYAAFVPPARALAAVDDPEIEVVHATPEAGGAYRELRVRGFELTPHVLASAADGSVLIGGPCALEDRSGPRSGFGIVKLDPSGEPDSSFGKKLGEGRIGLAFAPLEKDEEAVDVVGLAIQPGEPGREKVVLLGNVRRVGASACVGVVRVDLDDGKPSKLDGEVTLRIGFGNGFDGRSRARALGVSADAITVGGDWNGHPAFLRLDGKKGAPDEGFGEDGKRVVEVESFATPAYDHTTDLETCVVEADGSVLGIGRLMADEEDRKVFQILVALDPSGVPDPRFGQPSASDGGATRVGATTSYYQLPVDHEVVTELSMAAAVAAGPLDDGGKLFAGLGTFAAPGGPPLCSMNLIRLHRVENQLTAKDVFELESDIYAVSPRDVDPSESPLQPAGLHVQLDGELLALVTDADGRLYASQHDVLDNYYPDAVRDLEPRIDEVTRSNLFYGLELPAAPMRVLSTLVLSDSREYVVVGRAVEGEPLVLRRYNLNNGALDDSW